MIKFILNEKKVEVNVEDDTPLLWVLRDSLKMMGTKYGCGKGLCGSCTIHLNGIATRSCMIPISSVEGQNITTIEGLSKDNSHPLQKAWIKFSVPQCGYCQSGQLMSASALLNSNTKPSEDEINQAMSGNICRCGTHLRIKQAIKYVAK